MIPRPKLVVDGVEIAPLKWSRAIDRRCVARARAAAELRRYRRIKATGIMVAIMNAGFAPTLALFVTAQTTSTTTVPSGATSLKLEAWGGGGNGGGGTAGFAGGSGAYTLCTLSCAASNGKTLVVTCTQTALAGQTCPPYTVQSGSFSISTISAGCGTGGPSGNGGTAANANSGATNINGVNGTSTNATPAASNGNIPGDGGPYGTGGGHLGGNAQLGAVVFYYT
jgi:hypothetical protein